MQNYKELNVWIKGMDLAEEIYRITKKLPKEETYSLTDQMRRAAVSIPSNISEGNGRGYSKEYAYFLSIARGSVFELNTQLWLCVRRTYRHESDIEKSVGLCDDISKMLYSMITKLKSDSF